MSDKKGQDARQAEPLCEHDVAHADREPPDEPVWVGKAYNDAGDKPVQALVGACVLVVILYLRRSFMMPMLMQIMTIPPQNEKTV